MRTYYLNCVAGFKSAVVLFVAIVFCLPLSAQQLKIKDFAVWGGSAPATTYNNSQGVFMAGNVSVTGNIGSNHLVDVKKDLTLNGNIFSGNGISLAAKNTLTGNMTALKASQNFTGNVINSNNKSDFIGNITGNGIVFIKTNNGNAASTVTGKVSVPVNTNYTGPTPTGGVNNIVTLPTLPAMPVNTPFDDKAGTVDVTTNRTLLPGSYRNLALKGNATVTLNGPGTFIFLSVNNTGTANQIKFNFQGKPGTIYIFVVKEANFGEINASIDGEGLAVDYAGRIYTEIHNVGSAASAKAFTLSGPNSSWIGTVWAPFRDINIKSSKNTVTGALWSGTGVVLDKDNTITYKILSSEPSFVSPYYPPPIKGKVDETNNIIGAELFSLATNSPIISIIPDNTTFRIQGNKVMIEVISKVPNDETLLNELIAAGLTGVVNNGPHIYVISGYFPINLLPSLNTNSRIEYVRPLFPPLNNVGQTTTQGDITLKSDKVRDRFNLDGTGVKVGVLSDSYNSTNTPSAASDVSEGDLPNDVQVALDYPGHDEGRAMLQIVHDIAPQAKLAFRTGFQTAGDFAQGIRELAAPGLAGGRCDVLVDDITYITEPFLRDGVVANTVNQVVSQGVTYFSSAGNFGKRSYEAVFNPVTNTAIAPAPATLHQFSPGQVFQTLSLKPGSYTIVLQWNDDFHSLGSSTGVQNDLDLYLVGSSGLTLFGFNRSNIFGDPFEVCPFTVTDETEAKIIIVNATGNNSNVRFKYIIFRGDGTIVNNPNTAPSTIVGHPNAEGCIAVGAMLYAELPGINVGQFPGVASFSSRGGTFTLGSNASYAPRQKPDIIAPNGVNTTVTLGAQPTGFSDSDEYPNFFGTSAAAPHAAGVAALLVQARKKFDLQTTVSTADIRNLLQSSAGQFAGLNSPHNYDGGFGFVRADAAVLNIANAKPTIISLGLNGPATSPQKPNGIDPFPVKVKGTYLSANTQIYFRGAPIVTTVSADLTEATGIIPPFAESEDPAVQLFNPAKTISELDGGLSEAKYFFSSKKEVRVKAENITRSYGQASPTFTVKIWIDNVPIENTAITPAALKLDGNNVSYFTNADPLSVVGLYGIIPSRAAALNPAVPAEETIIKNYSFTFETGTLSVGKMPLKITPQNKTIKYGDYIGEVTYNYELNNSQPGLTDLLNQVKGLHKKYIADNALGVINGFKNQTTFDTTYLANMSAMASFQAVSNARKFNITNGQLRPIVNQINNSEFADQRFLIDIAAESFQNYKTNSAQSAMVASVGEGSERGVLNIKSLANGSAKSSLSNGQLQAMVNGQLLAMVNGQLRALVNGQLRALVNGETDIEGTADDYVFENGQLRALVNGAWIIITNGQLQAIVNGTEFLVDISVTNGQLQAIVNGTDPQINFEVATNGQLQAIVNGQLLALVNGQLQALVNGQLMPIVNGQLMALINGQLQPIVNGQLMALVNGQLMALVNGQLMALVNGRLETITNLTQLANGQLQALVNGQLQAIVNGQLKALVNGIVTDIPATDLTLINGQLQALVNGQLQALVNGQLRPLVNGQLQAIVNQLQKVESLQQLANGQLQAIVNGQLLPLVNGQLQAMVNGIATDIPTTGINLVNGQLQALVNGQLQALVNGQLRPLVNGQLMALVNGQLEPVSELTQLANGQLQALVNGQLIALVNGQLQALVNGTATIIPNASVSFLNGQLQALVNGQLQALVNGQLQALVNGQLQPLVNGDLQPVSSAKISNGQLRAIVNNNNIPIVNGQLQAIVNGQLQPLVNGQLLAMVNGQLMAIVNGELTFAVISNGQLQALVNKQLQPIVNNGGPIANGQLQAIVNGQLQPLVNASFTNGQLQALVNSATGPTYALANGQLQPLVNGQLQPIVNNFNVSGADNNANTVVIVDEHDITLQGGSLGGMFAVNMITGLEVGDQKLIPGAFVNDNFEVTYGLGDVTITRRPLVIKADDKSKTLGAANPELTLTVAPLAYNDTNDDIILPSISTTAITNSPEGNYPITLTGGSADNYDLILRDGTLVIGIAPSITCPGNIVVDNTPGQCGAFVTFAATETTGSPASTINYSHVSGSLFPIGTTTVTATATNAVVSSVCTFTVTVVDNEAPAIGIPSEPINFPAGGGTPVSSWDPMIKTFNDPLPPGAVIIGASLSYGARDQGWGYTNGVTQMYVSDTRIGGGLINRPEMANDQTTIYNFNLNYTGSIPAYVYGGENTLKMYFVGYPGWQSFWEGGTLTLHYLLGNSLGNITVQCAASVPIHNAALFSAIDNCSATVTHDGDVISNQTNDNNYTITRTYKATDPSGNFATATQIITVVDNQAPIAVCQPVSVTLADGTATVNAISINNGSSDNCTAPLSYEFLIRGNNGGQRTVAVNSGARDERSLTGITYTYNGQQNTLTPANAIRSTLVLSTLTANSTPLPLPAGDANRFWDVSATSMTESTALRVLGDFDLGTAFQDCADPVGVNHKVIFDTPIVPGAGPEIFIVHGGLAFDIEILDVNGNVALTIPAAVINSSSNVIIGGSAVSGVFNAFYLRNNVNYAVEYNAGHFDTQNQILALDINYEEIPLIGGIRFGGGPCNYVYEILGFQPTATPTTASQIVFNSANDGVNHVTLKVTDASGNSSTCESTVTVNGSSAARTSQIASDTSEEIALVKEVKEVIAKQSIYPNPATNSIKLQLGKEIASPNNIILFNAVGRLQSNLNIRQLNSKLFEINISALPKGVYFIKARTLAGDQIFKFVKL